MPGAKTILFGNKMPYRGVMEVLVLELVYDTITQPQCQVDPA